KGRLCPCCADCPADARRRATQADQRRDLLPQPRRDPVLGTPLRPDGGDRRASLLSPLRHGARCGAALVRGDPEDAMIPETSLAFGPPEARAAATAGPDLPDRISLRDHVVEAEIGAFQEERGRRQRVAFGVVVEVAPRGPTDDDV